MVLAQFGPGTTGSGGIPPELVTMVLGIFVVAVVIGLIISIFFLLTLSKALSLCHPRNRTMEPGMVWLNFIPCFGIIWIFITVNRISESLKNEFYDRRLPDDGDFGKNLGITYLVLSWLGIIPYLGILFSIAGLICFILYWVKIAGYNTTLRIPVDDRDDRGSLRRIWTTTTGTGLGPGTATGERMTRQPSRHGGRRMKGIGDR